MMTFWTLKMKTDRRFFIAILAIVAIWSLGFFKNQDVSMAISGVAIGLAGANAWEKRGTNAKPTE